MKFKNYIALIPLFLFLLVESNQTLIWYTLQFQKGQREGFYKPKKRDLKKIRLKRLENTADIEWISKDEIRYQNHYFDIVYMDRDKNGFTLYLENDDHSEELKKQLKKDQKRKDKNKLRNLKKQVLSQHDLICFNFDIVVPQKVNNSTRLLELRSMENSIPTPPPEILA